MGFTKAFKLLMGLAALPTLVHSLGLTVSTTGGNASSPILYGFMFEDINHSGDGGIHGQLLRNNGFQGTTADLTAYAAVGSVTLAVDTAHPLSSALPKVLRIDVPSGTTGQVGFSNAGYWGIPVKKDTYACYFWVEGAYTGDVTVKLQSVATGTVFGTKAVAVTSVAGTWKYYETTFTASAAPDGDNIFVATVDAAKVSGSIYFNLFQLFPVTYHQRYNGLKPDIAGALENVKGSFLRFPGGNNLEGATVDRRWKWNETIGPVHTRPGRQGDWSYANTDALGLLEYLYWCEDMKLIPVLGVWAGLSLGGGVVTGTALTPYITDVLNEIEYITGSTSTTYGALRASHGRTEPFALTHVEIGNEDFIAGGLASYAARFTAFHDAIKAKYPDIIIIASTDQGLPSPKPAGMWIDIHYYLRPDQFVALFNTYDNYDRNYGIFVGEYACTTSNAGGRNWWATLIGAVSEAVFMIGMERNSDVVKMAAYAPLMQHFNSTQWAPDLIGYTSDPSFLTLSTSYYVQQMFSVNRGTTILPVTSDTGFGPAYWVASKNDNTGTYYVKMANYGATAVSTTITIPGATAGSVTTLTGPASDSINLPKNAVVVPVTTAITGSGGKFTISLPAWSVVVVAVK
ncbi:uncharacterized protein H6S33_001550 [Morchella sextelata]|uniref:uncharacterized protein n=1 Tax=Morchella sextelata TaxID=1174677 RepID=UPI001D04070F|nr:uncharacterized protein H6S33_001550 [Morchella sextelata]KAH0608416.1 hypothetical protein H6S33_001550 [Morchella sextelata]